MTATQQRLQTAIYALALFVFFYAVYLLSFSGMFHSGDEIVYVRTAIDMAQGRLSTPGHGGVFVAALALVFELTHRLAGIGPLQAMFLLNIPVTALTGVLIFLLGRELLYSKKAGIFVALLYGLTTPAWVYSKALFREPWAACGLTAAMYFAVRFKKRLSFIDLGLAGLCLGLGIATRVSVAVAAPFLFIYVYMIVRNERLRPVIERGQRVRFLSVLLALLALVVLALGVVFATYGGLLPGLLRAAPDGRPLAGLLFSPARGLFVYAPVTLLALFSIPSFVRAHRGEAFVMGGSSLVYLLVSSFHPMWWGGWNWGPRFLVAFLPWIIFPLIDSIESGLSRRQRAWAVPALLLLGAMGLVVQLFGISVGPSMPTFSQVLQTADAFHWRMLPVAWPPWDLSHFTLDLAWARVGKGMADRAGLILSGVAASLGALGVLLHFRRSAPLARQVSIWLMVALLALIGSTVASLRTYYSLDARYGGPDGYGAALERVAAHNVPGDILVADFWSSTDHHILPTRLLNYCRGNCPPYELVAREPWQTNGQQTAWLARMTSTFTRLWLIPINSPGGDPNSVIESSLNAFTYEEGCEWTGPATRLCLYYNLPSQNVKEIKTGQNRPFGNQILLQNARVHWQNVQQKASAGSVSARPGQALFVDLDWQARGQVDTRYKMSLQLFDAAGQVQKQVDREPLDGFRPTTSWKPGEMVADKVSFVIPASAPTGIYRLRLVVYDPQTMQRLFTDSGDLVDLAEIELSQP